MPHIVCIANVRRPVGLAQAKQKEGLAHVLNALGGCVSGTKECETMRWGVQDATAIGDSAYAGQAAALLTMASSSGDVGATIAGSEVLVTWATSDTASATALAAAIRAHAVNRIVTATNELAKMTCASVIAGTTVDVWGARFTAIASGATPKKDGEFSVGASDTACAAALAAAINRHPSVVGRGVAVSSAGVVYVGKPDASAAGQHEAIRSPSATTITVNAAIPVAGAVTMVVAQLPGVQGNEIRCVEEGTNVTAATNGTSGLLGGGTGGFVSTYSETVAP